MSDPLDIDQQINDAIDLLRQHGYSVTLPPHLHRLETPGEFRTRLGISTMRFACGMAAPGCPEFFCEQGPSGRILKLRSNPDFDAFMQGKGGGK